MYRSIENPTFKTDLMIESICTSKSMALKIRRTNGLQLERDTISKKLIASEELSECRFFTSCYCMSEQAKTTDPGGQPAAISCPQWGQIRAGFNLLYEQES